MLIQFQNVHQSWDFDSKMGRTKLEHKDERHWSAKECLGMLLHYRYQRTNSAQLELHLGLSDLVIELEVTPDQRKQRTGAQPAIDQLQCWSKFSR